MDPQGSCGLSGFNFYIYFISIAGFDRGQRGASLHIGPSCQCWR